MASNTTHVAVGGVRCGHGLRESRLPFPCLASLVLDWVSPLLLDRSGRLEPLRALERTRPAGAQAPETTLPTTTCSSLGPLWTFAKDSVHLARAAKASSSLESLAGEDAKFGPELLKRMLLLTASRATPSLRLGSPLQQPRPRLRTRAPARGGHVAARTGMGQPVVKTGMFAWPKAFGTHSVDLLQLWLRCLTLQLQNTRSTAAFVEAHFCKMACSWTTCW